jgi:hypothetical protein
VRASRTAALLPRALTARLNATHHPFTGHSQPGLTAALLLGDAAGGWPPFTAHSQPTHRRRTGAGDAAHSRGEAAHRWHAPAVAVQVKRPASSTVSLPASRPWFCCRAALHIPPGSHVVFEPAALMSPRSSRRRFPGRSACGTGRAGRRREELGARVAAHDAADRPGPHTARNMGSRPPLTPASPGAHAAHRSAPTPAARARTPLLGPQRARRVPLPGRHASPAVARRQDHAQPQPH